MIVEEVVVNDFPDLWQVFERVQGDSVSLLLKPAASGTGFSPFCSDHPPVHPSLGFYSSGSTGIPKLVWRSWRELLAEISPSARTSRWAWATSFDPCSFAGLQVALQAWKSGGDVIGLRTYTDDAWQSLSTRQAQALSCTPTFLELLLRTEPVPRVKWAPLQITLGGEVFSAKLGALARARFPTTRITIIYASAELGVLLKTQRLDGWYEDSYLTKRFSQWRLRDLESGEALCSSRAQGELEVLHQGAWVPTRDQIERRDNLLRIVGRSDSIANIGGVKIDLNEVARLAEEVPGIQRAVAVTEPNPVCGQIVCLKYSVEAGHRQDEVSAQLQSRLRAQLPKAAWPRRWQLDAMTTLRNSKLFVT